MPRLTDTELRAAQFSGPGDRPRTPADVALLVALTVQKNIACSDFVATGIGNELLHVFKHHGLRIVWRPPEPPPAPGRPRALIHREERKARERR